MQVHPRRGLGFLSTQGLARSHLALANKKQLWELLCVIS